jgi:4-hydroxybenzoate polyprenyltransferase
MAESAVSLPSAAGAAAKQRQSDFAFLLQVSRPGLWTTTTLFYLMPLGHSVGFGSARFWAGLVYILIPLGFLLYGVNDIADAEADRINPRKGTFLFGSRGRAEQLRALRWQIAVVQIPFLAAFLWWIGPAILWWFAILLLAVGLYNAPRIGLKTRPPFDVLIQASYLLVFVLSSWLNGVAQLPWQTFLFGALFAMHSHLFGEVLDIVPDRKAGRATTAVRIGVVRTKLLIAAILTVETTLVAKYFHDAVIAGFLAAGAAFFVIDASAVMRERPYGEKLARVFMWAWNGAAVLLMAWDYTQGSLTHATR